MAGERAASSARADGARRPILGLKHPGGLGAALGPTRVRALRDGLSVVGVLVLGFIYFVGRDFGYDAYAYWRALQGDPYGVLTGLGAYHYSPVFLFALSPFAAVDWPEFYWLIVGLSFGALLWLGRWWTLALLAFFPIASELYHGNVDLLIAAAIVAGFRWPAAWSFVLLTKITPGIGLLWFAVRREWRSLVIALGATMALAIPTILVRPDLWTAWVAHLSATGPPAEALVVPVPLAVRLVAAAALVAWGARTDRRWTVVVGATIAQPILGIIGFSMLAGLAGLRHLDRSGAGWRIPPIDGRFAIVTTGFLLLVIAIVVVPVFALEEVRDWRTYADAGARLAAGSQLYVVDGSVAYLYPPPMALLWSLGLTELTWLVLKLVALLGVAALGVGYIRAVLVGLALLATPVQHDLVIGNVMAVYLGALCVLLARPGWLGAAPLGLVLAAAAKPVVGPILLVLAILRPRDAGRVVAVALVASIVCAAIVGPGRYLEYLSVLPQIPGSLDAFEEGNLGLGRLSPAAAAIGLVAGYALAVWAALRLDPTRALIIGLAAGLLAQPTVPFYYGVLLVPALILLWRVDRPGALAGAWVGSLLVFISPVAAGLAVVALAVRPVPPPDRNASSAR